MHFLLILLFVVVFSEPGSAASFYQPCSATTKCNSPGLICEAYICVCDSKHDLFWTGARCLECPKGWMRTETRCINYFATKLTWTEAQEHCAQMQANLFSYHDDTTITLMYQLAIRKNRRKKEVEIATDNSVVWSGGQAVPPDGQDLYKWLDNSLPTFDSKSKWWCKRNMAGFDPSYRYDEPTRYIDTNGAEDCLLSRRGTGSTAVLCLDDIVCNEKYPFICERSESTAQFYIGPPPHAPSDDNSGSGDSGNSSSGSSSAGGSTLGNNSTTDPGAITPGSKESKSHKKSKVLIIWIVALGLLLLAGVLIGVFFFQKHRKGMNIQETGLNEAKRTFVNMPPSPPPPPPPPAAKIETKVGDISDGDEFKIQRAKSDEIGLTLNTDSSPANFGINIGNQKQQKNKKGGYSKQQFENEFE